ncbi:hypothetical protein [Ferruginibacter sp.]
MKKIILSIAVLFFFLAAAAQKSATGIIRGKLYYDLGSKKSKTGADLRIYLIPKTAANTSVVKNASAYTASCDEKMLCSAKNYKVTISDKGGYYYFTNVTQGIYLIKICTYYGGYYSFTIKTNFKGTINLPDFEVDPPVR